MTLKFILPMVLLLVGAGCREDVFKNVQKPQGAETNAKVEAVFDCEVYRDSTNRRLEAFNATQKREIRDSNNSLEGEPVWNTYIDNKELKELFFSPKLNKCVYIESSKTLMRPGTEVESEGGDWKVVYDTYYLIDPLTGEEINFNGDLPFLQITHRGEVYTPAEDVEKIISTYR